MSRELVITTHRARLPVKIKKIKHDKGYRLESLCGSSKRKIRRDLFKKIAVVKEKKRNVEIGGYICPGPLSVGIVLSTKKTYN